VSTFNTLVAGTAGVVGWLVVSYLLDRSKSKRQDSTQDSTHDSAQRSAPDSPRERPPQITHDLPAPGPTSAPKPLPVRDIPGGFGPVSLDEIGRTWHTILGVSSEARADEIERAYYAKLAECDRARLASDVSPDARRRVEQQRALLTQAFEFIRPLRS
jgi:DnaJ-domain-containing protein 1